MSFFITLVLTALLAGPAAAAQPSFQELEESLTCQCGCGLTVHSCNHVQCGSALPLRKEIRAQMDKGWDKPAILAYFVDKYGEKILSSPTTSGFNLTAWIAPFVAVALGGLLVVFTLLRWRRSKLSAQPPNLRPVGESRSSPYEKILERELERFDT